MNADCSWETEYDAQDFQERITRETGRYRIQAEVTSVITRKKTDVKSLYGSLDSEAKDIDSIKKYSDKLTEMPGGMQCLKATTSRHMMPTDRR